MPQQGGWIARAQIIVDPKVYSGKPMPQGMRRLHERTVVAAGGDFCFFPICCKYNCQALMADLMDR